MSLSLFRAVRIFLVLATMDSVQGFAQRQMENLGRGVVAVRTSATQVYVGWRLLGTDPADTGFNLYRVTGGITTRLNGSQPLTSTTEFLDAPPNLGVPVGYFVRPVVQAIEQPASASFTLPGNPPVRQYLEIPLQVPAGGTTPDGVAYTYSPGDCSAGDLDGDGEYELVLKWDPSNSKDNSQSGYTGNVFLDAYKLDGARLWRVDLGINIRAGAHYTQFMVYDLDGDGRAEVACKTAPGTQDGLGQNVILGADDPNADHRNTSGYILSGPEYLTLFDGLSGAAMVTASYLPLRGNVNSWGDDYGNRVDRFLACVAYLDGIRPSLVMCRGYYTRAVLAAWDWRDGQLKQRWVFDSNSAGNGGYAGQGNHNLSVADVDGDGKEEVLYGACVIDDNGTGLYTTLLGHGDAMHVSDFNPARPGLESFNIHEPVHDAGSELHDARTGLVFWRKATTTTEGPGRGVAADVYAGNPGAEMWSSGGGIPSGLYDLAGNPVGRQPGSANFLAWWDADPVRELLDGNHIDKYGTNSDTRLLTASGASSINGTKSTPCLSADLLGDWREEVVWRSSDNQYLRIYTTTIRATNRFATLMHDAQYRMAIAWQNVAYNQPPHPGFHLGHGMVAPPPCLVSSADLAWRGGQAGNAWDLGSSNWIVNGVWTNSVPAPYVPGDKVVFDLRGSSNPVVSLIDLLSPGEVKVHSPVNYVLQGSGSLAGQMKLVKAGTGLLTVNTTNTYTGETEVAEGTLLVNGILAQSPVRVRRGVWLGSSIGGNGILGAGAVVESGGGIIPGNGTNWPGTLTISNSLSLADDNTLFFDLSSDPAGKLGTNDRIQIFGDLSLQGSNRVEITALDGILQEGIYPLIDYSGSLNGGVSNLYLSAAYSRGATLTNPPGRIALLVSTNVESPGPENLVWKGDGNGNTWDKGLSFNWTSAGEPALFDNGDTVKFDETGSANSSINLLGVLEPAEVTVDAEASYTFGGPGAIAGTNALFKAGNGRLTVSTGNGYSGGTVISNGTIVLGNDTANLQGLGTGLVTMWGGVLSMNDSSGSYTTIPWNLHVPAGAVARLNADSRCDWYGTLTGGGDFVFYTPWVRSTVFGSWSGFTGMIRVICDTDGGEFRLANATGIPAARLNIASGVLMYSRASAGAVIPIGEFSADAGAIVSAGFGSSIGVQNAVTWRVGGLGTDATNRATIQGTTSLIKEGSGIWTLTGTNSYTGTTTVNGGTLVIEGDQAGATGQLNVAANGSLAGRGIVGGTAVVNGLLSPGSPAGSLLFNADLVLGNGSVSAFEIGGEHGNDAIQVAGEISMGGTLVVTHLGQAFAAGRSFTLVSAGSRSGTFTDVLLPPLGPGLVWDTSRLTSEGKIEVVTSASMLFSKIALLPDGNCRLHLSGQEGQAYELRASTNLLLNPATVWDLLSTGTFGVGPSVFDDLAATNHPERFYRLRGP